MPKSGAGRAHDPGRRLVHEEMHLCGKCGKASLEQVPSNRHHTQPVSIGHREPVSRAHELEFFVMALYKEMRQGKSPLP